MKRRFTHVQVEALIAAFLLVVIIIAVIASLPDERPETYSCVETDKGDDPFTFGLTTDWRSGQSVADKCESSAILQEFACDFSVKDPRGSVTVKRVPCSCNQGKCVVAELAVTEMLISRQPRTNDEFKVTFRIENTGEVEADPVDIDVYFEPGYAFLIEPPKSPLLPGESTTVTYSVNYAVPGRFQIVSIVDPHDLVLERDENNERRDWINVQ
ncbi:hypothetical protein HY493_00395 [Candidatus Woesearchaeota archaeon]|nr:hypothetical protein [Candidatus Woesearchaeota archaeon]